MIHASADVPVEVYVDVPEASPENILFFDAEGNNYSLPNRATVRLQGPVILGRAEETEEVAPPVVRWRYVSSMFSFSRSRNGRTLP